MPLPNLRTREMKKYVHVKVNPPSEEDKQAEAAKTARLRGLRLAKEAADKDAAARAVAAVPQKRRRQLDHSTSPAS
jgi:hypothetical protein